MAKLKEPIIVRLEDGRGAQIVELWEETTQRLHGRIVSCYTKDESRGADLGRSKTGLWILLPWSHYQYSDPQPRVITREEAALWFAACGIDLPEELVPFLFE
jgi:hypothetical protein